MHFASSEKHCDNLKKDLDIEKLLDGIRKGKMRSLARAVSLIEERSKAREKIIKKIFSETGNSLIIGVTGFPGVGKSTLISKIVEKFREKGETVGVIATDPSSPFTNGAFLGDRLRLGGHDSGMDLWTDPGVFYRSVSTRGEPGGVPRVIGDILTLMDAFGFDKIIIETAGAGQSEVDMIEFVDTSIVVLMPGVGDRIQFGKAGILEIGDIFVVNKSDLDGASEAERFLKEMMSFEHNFQKNSVEKGENVTDKGTHHYAGSSKFGKLETGPGEIEDQWIPPIILTIAKNEKGEGIENLTEAIQKHVNYLEKSNKLRKARKRRAKKELENIVGSMIITQCRQTHEVEFEEYVKKISDKKLDPYTSAEKILNKIIEKD